MGMDDLRLTFSTSDDIVLKFAFLLPIAATYIATLSSYDYEKCDIQSNYRLNV